MSIELVTFIMFGGLILCLIAFAVGAKALYLALDGFSPLLEFLQAGLIDFLHAGLHFLHLLHHVLHIAFAHTGVGLRDGNGGKYH